LDDASVQAVVGSSASSLTPETAASAGAVVDSKAASDVNAAAVSAPAAVTGGEEVTASAPSNESEAKTILTLAPSGQSGAQADPNGQGLAGEGGDAVSTEAASVRVASVSASQAAASTADPDGSAAVGQATQSASSAPGANSAGSTTAGSTPSTAAGAAAPAQRAEAVAQPQGATEVTPDVELHEQVSPVIVRQARLISGSGGHELTVRLNPDHLGPLHVRISLLEGVLSVGLTTANSEAQRAIENALPQLRGALVESGLRLDRLDVSQRDTGNGRDASGNGQSGNQRGSANAGRGNGNQPGYAGNDGRQANTGDSGTSFADVLLDQDGRAFGSVSRSARSMGYRAYRRA
jgi:flagellar hook-length control protein FliK